MSLTYSQKLPMGWQAPDFSLKGIDNLEYSLQNFANKPGLLLIFTCDHCPYAQAAWPLLVEYYDTYKEVINFVAINPNDGTEYPEDSLEGMKNLAAEKHVVFPYLRDETQQVAKSYQAECTPDIYLFKNEGQGVFKLHYHGRVNDNWQHKELVTEHSLKLALQRLAGDEDPLIDQHPSMGCSIKWSN